MQFVVINSSTPSTSSITAKIAIKNNCVKWILWSDLNEIKQLTHYCLIFDDYGNNKITIISSSGSHELISSSEQPNIYGFKVINGSFPIFDRKIFANTLSNIKHSLSVLLPGVINYINTHSEIRIGPN